MAYNGWRNRETWLVNVWFNPERASDLDSIKEQMENDYDNLPDYMKDFVDLEAIDWDELRDALDDDEDGDE